MRLGIADDLGRRVEAHRLGVQQSRAEDVGMPVKGTLNAPPVTRDGWSGGQFTLGASYYF